MNMDRPAIAPDPDTGKPDWAMSRGERRRAERVRQGLPPPRRRWPWVVLLLLVALGAAAWTQRGTLLALIPARSDDPAAAEAPGAPRLTQLNASEWAVIEPQLLRRTVKVIGTLQPSRQSDLSAETSGQVQQVAARPGDAVTEGQVLVQVDVESLTLDLDLARSNAESTRAQVRRAEAQLERAQALVERGVNSATSTEEAQTTVDQLSASLAAQEDQIRSAELALSRATVRAPFDGVVASRSVEPGAVVAAGTPLLTVVSLARMEMLGAAPVSSGAELRPGQEVDLRVDGIAGRTFRGSVERIAPVAEEGTRTVTVYVDIGNPDGTLLGGMFATGEVVLAEAKDALAVPQAALREGDGRAYVLTVAEDGTLARADVTQGPEWPGRLVQVEGLAPGARVVTAALEGLEPGERVELVDY